LRNIFDKNLNVVPFFKPIGMKKYFFANLSAHLTSAIFSMFLAEIISAKGLSK